MFLCVIALPVHAGSVLVWSSGNSSAGTAAVAAWIQASGLFTSVTGVDANSMTLAQLSAYNEVLYFSNNSSAGQDPTAIGDVLDAYAATGNRLVLATFSWAEQGGNTLGGGIISTGDSPFLANGATLYSFSSMASNDGSAFFSGVNSVTGYYRDDVVLSAGAILRASWADGTPLEATKGNIVAVDLFPDDSYGLISGDYRQLFINALSADEQISNIPEPGTLGLVAFSLLALVGRISRRKS
jgi:hypothetical protein